jgi:hypothetical protein
MTGWNLCGWKGIVQDLDQQECVIIEFRKRVKWMTCVRAPYNDTCEYVQMASVTWEVRSCIYEGIS